MFVMIYYGFNFYLVDQYYKETSAELDIENKKIMMEMDNISELTTPNLIATFDSIMVYSTNVIYVLDTNSTVIYDTLDDHLSIVGTTIDSEQVHATLGGKSIHEKSTLNNTFSKMNVIASVPIIKNNQVVAALVNTAQMPAITDVVKSISFAIFLVLIIILAIAFAFTYFFSTKVTNIIGAFNITAKNIASGQLASRVDMPYTDDDVGILAKNMNYMAEELQRVDNMRKEFIANISHDLRSPLTSIGGFAQAMLDGTIRVDNQRKYLQIILTQTEHLTNLTQNILLLTQMENNIIKLEKTNFDIHHLLKKVLIQFEKNIVDKDIKVSLITDNDALMVNADLNQIQRVIYNIIDNALKFSSSEDELTIETTITDGKVQISISDTGIGMSDTEIKYMWVRFHKGDKSRGQDKKGFGIGLSIVREIINAHQQSIEVFSQLGKGTTFIFTLDLAI